LNNNCATFIYSDSVFLTVF